MKRFFALVLLLALLPAAAAETYTVTVSDFAFSPAELEIEVGDTVVFIWNDTASAHNVAEVGDADANDYNGGFRSGDPQAGGGNWSLPAEYTMIDGTLEYVCVPHAPGMRGSIIGGSGAAPIPEMALSFGDFPWLSYLLLLPLLGALWCWGFRNHPGAPRIIALGTTMATLLLSVVIFMKALPAKSGTISSERIAASIAGA